MPWDDYSPTRSLTSRVVTTIRLLAVLCFGAGAALLVGTTRSPISAVLVMFAGAAVLLVADVVAWHHSRQASLDN